MRDAYDALLNEYRSRYRKMTPKQQIRELKHQDFIAKTVSKQNLFCSVYGLSDYVTPMNHKGERSVVTGYDAIALEFAKLRWNVVCYALCREKKRRSVFEGYGAVYHRAGTTVTDK